MRKNLPVTNREYVLEDDDLIISRTDLKGFMTWANPDFIRISGYDVSELIGKPHNLLRHPDMPPEAFKDLWDTVQAGRGWTGIVKNRRKDGDHYWVQADVTPIREGGRIVGYTSIRGKATPEQVKAAETLYSAIWAHKASVGSRRKWSTRARLITLTFFALGVGIGAGLLFPAHPLSAIFVLISGILAAGIGMAAFLDRLKNISEALRTSDYRSAIPVTGSDEVAAIAGGVNILFTRFYRVMQELRRTSKSLQASSEELKEGNLDLCSRTESQAAALEQTAQGLQQVGEAVDITATRAQEVAKETQAALDQVRSGSITMAALSKSVAEAHSQSARILEITGLVDELAFQTNLLSLNAAVEAARAGEHGRGFAVVAGEVRGLASRSAESAKEIRNLLKSAEAKTRHASELAHEAEGHMEALRHRVDAAGNAVREIAAATQDQSSGLREIRAAMGQLETLTHRNAALVEEAGARAEELEERALILEGLAGCFIR